MTSDPTRTFARALQELERTEDVDRFVSSVFTDGVELSRPETGQHNRGSGGAREFWQQYLDQFDDVSTDFERIVEAEVGVLEWTSSGHLSTGTEISYRGVSVLDFDADGRVTRFTTYYDTAPFSLPR